MRWKKPMSDRILVPDPGKNSLQTKLRRKMLDLFRYIGCNCVRSSFGGALWTIYLVRMLFLTSQM